MPNYSNAYHNLSLQPKNPDETRLTTRNGQATNHPDSFIKYFHPIYDRQIPYAVEIKFINDCYITHVTVELGNSDSENSVHLPVKHRKLFAALKILDPLISILINDTIVNHPGEFQSDTVYTETFYVITDKKPRFPRFLVHYKIHSKIQVSTLKYGENNIMLTLQSLNTWLTFNRFSTHREASIDFLKYISTCLTFQYIAKKRLTFVLMNVDLTDEGSIALKQTIENDVKTLQSVILKKWKI